MGRLFGTDGVRAVAGEYPLDPSSVFKLGLALVKLGMRKILIGRDTRASSVWIERILERAIRSEGGEPDRVGVISTPGVSFLACTQPFEAGVVVSASHNPYTDNGIKIFSHDGTKISDDKEDKIERVLAQNCDIHRIPPETFENWEGELTRFEEAQIWRYIESLKTVPGRRLDGLRVVLDCANGAAFHIAPRVFRELGANVSAINVQPDGYNINRDCGALHPDAMMRETRKQRASFGVAFDGDCDRAILSDEEGSLVDGDHLLFILGQQLRKRGLLQTDCVVTTVMANIGLEIGLRRAGLSMVRTRVGDRYVLEEMLRYGHSLGGEQSGHIIIRPHAMTGDGILTALKLAQILIEEGRPLSELRKQLQKFPQVLLNLRVKEKRDFANIQSISASIRAAEQRLEDRGRVVVRYSGTEPLVRIMIEGEDQQEIAAYAEEIAARFREELGTEANG
jgi:phosphoglucosamine mutase